MITLLLTWFLYSLAVTLLLVLYTEDDDQGETTPDKKIIGFVMPQYGGTPVYINQAIIAAQEIGDREAEQHLNGLRNKFFRNRRAPGEGSSILTKAKANWIKKYGTAALDHDYRRAKLAALTPEEQAVLIKAWEAENLPTLHVGAKPKPKAKKGGK